MDNELTNLLPQERCRSIRRDYFLRLSIVVASFIFVLAFTSSVLLLPTYVLLTATAHTKEAQLANIELTLSSSEEAVLSERLIALSNDSADIMALADNPSIITTIRSMLAIPRPGISLSGFSYSLVSKKNQKTLSISGFSATRDALRNYQLALQSAPFVQSVDLPISAYAKDTDINFNITVTLAP